MGTRNVACRELKSSSPTSSPDVTSICLNVDAQLSSLSSAGVSLKALTAYRKRPVKTCSRQVTPDQWVVIAGNFRCPQDNGNEAGWRAVVDSEFPITRDSPALNPTQYKPPGGEGMQVSEAGLELIKRSEGFRSSTYLDAAGIPTIGYGHRILRGESYPDGIDEAQACRMLAHDVRQAEETVERMVRVPLNQGEFDALVDFCFNLGPARLAGSTLLRDLNAGNYENARQELLLWDHAGRAIVAGLKARREAEFSLWNGDSGRSSTHTADEVLTV